ncbi:MAG: M56 family metallopeptidase, partial [Gammaproteobacteria bacterium]|nr:M56 family metallopeptidase [Gammaproteobacteria bacterium]
MWLNSLVCAALVPLFMALSSLLESSPAITTQLVAIQVIPSNAYVISTGTEFPSWASGLITVLYLLPILVLFIRLATSIANVLRINRNAEAVLDSATLNRLTQLRAEQHISRPVKVSYCSTIASPLSFGLFRPHIILPLRASSWDGKVLDDV